MYEMQAHSYIEINESNLAIDANNPLTRFCRRFFIDMEVLKIKSEAGMSLIRYAGKKEDLENLADIFFNAGGKYMISEVDINKKFFFENEIESYFSLSLFGDEDGKLMGNGKITIIRE